MREEEQKVVVVYLFFSCSFLGFVHIVVVSILLMVTRSGRGMDRVRNGIFKKLLPIEPPDF